MARSQPCVVNSLLDTNRPPPLSSKIKKKQECIHLFLCTTSKRKTKKRKRIGQKKTKKERNFCSLLTTKSGTTEHKQSKSKRACFQQPRGRRVGTGALCEFVPLPEVVVTRGRAGGPALHLPHARSLPVALCKGSRRSPCSAAMAARRRAGLLVVELSTGVAVPPPPPDRRRRLGAVPVCVCGRSSAVFGCYTS
jgi:hypothetical protein